MAGGNGGGAQLGTAYFELIPSMRGAGEAIRSQLDPQAGLAGDKVGGSMGGKLVAGLGKAISATATTVVGAAAGTLGTALTKGFARLDAIDQAQAKLRGLGHGTQEVSGIMSSALASVKGTAFGLGDAATVAAGAVAAGVQPGEALTGTLKTVADTATIAGASMGDIGLIFQSVAGQNKLMGGDLMQLQQRGIPVLAFLAKEYGVTSAEASKMVSNGQVDFAHFQKALSDNIGGAALQSGNTFRGAMANVGASLGRIGAGLEGGIFPKLAPLLQALTAALGPVETMAKQAGVAIGNALGPKIDALTGWLNGAAKGTGSLMDKLGPLTGLIGPLAAAFAALGAGGIGKLLAVIPGLGGLAGPLSALSGPIGIVVAALGGLVATSPALRSALGGLLTSVGGALSQAFAALGPTLGSLSAAFGQVATVIGGELGNVIVALTPTLSQIVGLLAGVLMQALPTLAPVLLTVGDAFAQIVEALTPLIPILVGALVPVVRILLFALTPLFPIITQIAGVLGQVLVSAVNALSPLLVLVAQVVAQILQAVTPLIPAFLALLVPILGLIAPLLQLVAPLLTPLVQLLIALLTPILSLIQPLLGLLVPALQLVAQVLAVVIGWVAQALTWFVKLVTGNKQAGDQFRAVWSSVMGFFGGIGQFFANIWNGIISGVSSFIGRIVGFFTSIPGTIGRLFAGAGTWLLDAGRNIVQGLLDGAGGLLRNIGNFFLNMLPAFIVGPFKAALGIHSPSRVFYEFGGNTVQGYVNALNDGRRTVEKAANDLVSVPSSAAGISPALTAAGRPGAGSSGPLVAIGQVVAPDQDPATSGRIIGGEMARRIIGEV